MTPADAPDARAAYEAAVLADLNARARFIADSAPPCRCSKADAYTCPPCNDLIQLEAEAERVLGSGLAGAAS